jgi:hypothetical protein
MTCGGYVIDTLYDHVNDIQKHVFEKGYVLNFTRDVNDIPMTCQGHVLGSMSLGTHPTDVVIISLSLRKINNNGKHEQEVERRKWIKQK